MSEHGATLQTYNQELVKYLEELKSKRSEIQSIINREECEKAELEKNIKILNEKLAVLNAGLDHHIGTRNSYDKIIQETDMGFKKILESSQMLLNLARHEADKLYKETKGSPKQEDHFGIYGSGA